MSSGVLARTITLDKTILALDRDDGISVTVRVDSPGTTRIRTIFLALLRFGAQRCDIQ